MVDVAPNILHTTILLAATDRLTLSTATIPRNWSLLATNVPAGPRAIVDVCYSEQWHCQDGSDQ